jgi:nucleoprotein TPR
LKADLEQAQGSSLVLEKQIAQLRTTLEMRDSKIEQLLQQLLQSREEVAEKERHFMEEMDAKSKIAGVYENSSEEASSRIRELEAQLEETLEAMRTVDERVAEIHQSHQAVVAQLQKAISEKDDLISSLKSQIAATEGTGLLSSNAGAALQTVRSGQSFSQVYSELTQARTGLLEASQENERLKSCLRDICEDIEARLPSIQADREENARLKSAVSSLSERMSSLSQERESLQSQLNLVLSDKQNLVKETKVLEQQVVDLGQQVQTLLLQQDTSVEVDADSGVVDSNKIISSRLVSVKNVAELQVRNQELLRVVRDLATRAEAAESQVRSLQDGSNVQPQLEAALKEIAQLREARAKQTAMVESLVANGASRQASLSVMPSASLSRPAVDLTADSEIDRSISGSDMFDPQLTLRLEEARSECMAVKSALAKAQAKAEFNQERLDLLKSNYDTCRSELEQSRSLQSEQSKSLVRVQSELQSMLGEVMNARESARKAESELSMLKTTLSVAQATERRLAAEKDGLQEEKQKLANLLSGLQAMIAESEASGQSLRERLSTQVESLERDL